MPDFHELNVVRRDSVQRQSVRHNLTDEINIIGRTPDPPEYCCRYLATNRYEQVAQLSQRDRAAG